VAILSNMELEAVTNCGVKCALLIALIALIAGNSW
jgi:hypothetical protein